MALTRAIQDAVEFWSKRAVSKVFPVNEAVVAGFD
jgi:hypothetical protein